MIIHLFLSADGIYGLIHMSIYILYQSDARSVRSVNDANSHQQHHKRSPSKRSNRRTSSKKRSAQSIKPSEIFARNLSDAVLDANGKRGRICC